MVISDLAEQAVYLRRTRAGTDGMMDDSTALVAQDAADALIVLGWVVRPAEDDSETWRIGYFVLTDDELIGFAARRRIMPAAETVQ